MADKTYVLHPHHIAVRKRRFSPDQRLAVNFAVALLLRRKTVLTFPENNARMACLHFTFRKRYFTVRTAAYLIIFRKRKPPAPIADGFQYLNPMN